MLALTRRLREKGKAVYCFVEDRDGNPQEYLPSYKTLPLTHEKVRADFEEDVRALRESDALILLLPAGASSHIEAGLAYGLGKRCILIGEMEETQGLYLIFSEIYSSTDEFLKQR